LRLIDSCITQLETQGRFRTCNESKEEEKKRARDFARDGTGGTERHRAEDRGSRKRES